MDPTETTRHELVALLPRLRRFARGLCGSAADADDLVQTAVEKALRKLHQFEPGTRLDSWMFRIVQTSYLDGRRTPSARLTLVTAEPRDPKEGEGGEDATLLRLEANAALRAMRDLPDEQRSAVTLILIEGVSYAEAAEILGVPPGTIASRVSRACAALQVALAPDSRRAESSRP